MIKRGKTAHASVQWAGMGTALYIIDRDDQARRILTDDGWKEYGDGLLVSPTVVLDMDDAQAFFEELWAQGFRSVNDRGGADALDSARKEHIADLRKVAKIAPSN